MNTRTLFGVGFAIAGASSLLVIIGHTLLSAGAVLFGVALVPGALALFKKGKK